MIIPRGYGMLNKYENTFNWTLPIAAHPISNFLPEGETLIVLWLGQSLEHQYSNHRYPLIYPDRQFQFLYGDGTIRHFIEPVFGEPPVGSPHIGSFFGQFADKVIANGLAGGRWKKSLQCFASLGGTLASDWGPSGKYHSILTTAFFRMKDAGLMPHFIGVGQGVTECFYGLPGSAWIDPWKKVVEVAHNIGITSPFFFERQTYFYGQISESVRAAQLAINQQVTGCCPGPDTDQYGEPYRWDNVHWGETGNDVVSTSWADIANNIN